MNSAKKIFASFTLFISFLNPQLKAQTNGNVFFAQPIVHDIQMTFAQSFYWDSLVAYMPLGQYLKGNITVDGVVYSNVGIKFKGNSSYSNPSTKKPFKVDMNEFVSGQDVDGLKKFNLNNGFKDPSFMREKMALDFYNEHGLAAPRCSYTKVTINGVYWGLYMFVEEADANGFLKAHFGNNEGNMFKGDPSGDLKWMGATPSTYYTKYELKTNQIVNDWSDLVNFIDNINNSGTNFHDSLETVFNTTSFIKEWAALNMFVNLDSYIGSGHNYFIYHDTLSDKFEWAAWDVNESFGNFNMGMTPTQLKNLSMFYVSSPSSSRPLVQNMLLDNSYKNLLISTICQWLAYDFSNAALDSKVDSLANAIRADVYSDTKKFFTNADFDNNLTIDVGPTMGIKPFITARRNALIAELATNGCNVGIAENTLEETSFFVYPNPANDVLNIVFNNSKKENSIRIFNSIGQEIVNQLSINSSERIDISSFPSGMYIINIDNNQFKKVQIIK